MINSSINIHTRAYFITLVLIAVSLPLSKFAMSITEFLLVGLWLWHGFSFRISSRFFKLSGFFSGVYHFMVYLLRLAGENIVEKFSLFFKNKAAVIISSVYLMHLLGLLYTEDMDYALKDLRIKLPLLLFPIVISTMYPIRYKQFRLLMLFYISAIFVGTLLGFRLIIQAEFTDIRYTSPYIGSIRFGLNVSFAFFTLLYFIILDKGFKNWHKVLFGITALWFLSYLVLLESVTSLSIIVLLGVFFLVYLSLQTKYVALKFAIILMAVGIPVVIFFSIRSAVINASTGPAVNFSELDQVTALGNPYTHDTIERVVEDGKWVGLYICEPELREAWNKRSSTDYDSYPENSHELRETLIRYMTSRNLRKDAAGVQSLTDKDIRMIEQGVANYHYVENPGLKTRLLKIMMGYEVYKKTGNPSGSSVMQRIEYSKASLDLIRRNFWFGVGTGDIEDKLISQYHSMGSSLKNQYMFHAHNQFLAVFISFGVFGFIWFVFALFYPPWKEKRYGNYFFFTFFVIMIWSMLSDDTLETQAGVTLFAFFYTLLLFGTEKQKTS